MLRFLVILLLLANAAYFAWSQRYLTVVGLAPVSQTEPARMQAQIKPDAMRLLSSNEAGRLEPQTSSTAASTSTTSSTANTATAATVSAKAGECLESGLLDERTALAVRNASAALPDGSWSMSDTSDAARWIVYMGKFANEEASEKKKSELRQIGVRFEALQNTSLEPGISLGGHKTQAEANKVLADLNKRGVRTAKVLQERPAIKGQVLRLPEADEALRNLLAPVTAALGTVGLKACKA
jgi:cell division protein FtsN